MQLASPPDIAELRAQKARLNVNYSEIEEALERLGYPYAVTRITKVLNGHEKSAPLCRAVGAALDLIEEDLRLAADGDRPAQDRLDAAEDRRRQAA